MPTITAISNPAMVCVGATATISATGASSYTWSSGPANSSFTVSPLTAGPFTYNVTGANSMCSANAQVTLTSVPLPVISVSSTSSSLCAGNSITITASGATTYSWSNGFSGAGFVATPLTGTTYTIVGISNNCSSATSIFIPVQALPSVSVASSASMVCIGAPVNLAALGASTYTWSNGLNAPALSFTAAAGSTSYSVIGAVGDCTASAVTTVQGVPLPTVSIASNPTVLCEGVSAVITASGASSYTWSNAATTNSILITPVSQINMSVYGTNGSCGAMQFFTLNVLPNPILTVVSDRSVICSGESCILQASGASSYTWNTGANTSSLVLSPMASTTYTVHGSNQNGCLNTTYYTQVVNLCLGLDEKTGSLQAVQIYPNPSNGSFVIKADALKENSIAQLLSIDGKVLLALPLTPGITQVDINHLARGVYMLRITGTEYVAKIIRD
jgi:hypothetical protein